MEWDYRSIGVSNFKIADLEAILAIANIKPAVNQVSRPYYLPCISILIDTKIFLHPYNWLENKELIEFSNKHGIITEAYGSLAYVRILAIVVLTDIPSLVRSRSFLEGQWTPSLVL